MTFTDPNLTAGRLRINYDLHECNRCKNPRVRKQKERKKVMWFYNYDQNSINAAGFRGAPATAEIRAAQAAKARPHKVI